MRAIFGAVGLLIGLAIGFVTGVIAMVFLYTPFFPDPPVNYQTIYFPTANTNIYSVAHIWGITGGSAEVQLCSGPYGLGKRDRIDDCVAFHTERIYYKKDGPTSLLIYAPSSSIPPNVKDSVGQINISVKGLKTFDEIKDFEQNFENYGLMTIAAPY